LNACDLQVEMMTLPWVIQRRGLTGNRALPALPNRDF